MRSFEVKRGFQIEIAAAEPEIADPVAMAFDESGRLFVIEMRGYSERREANIGRVRLLEDRDGDGRYEHAVTYADDLSWPTAILCWDGGVFVGATPDILYFKDVDQDGVAEVRRRVFTGFASESPRLNVQGMLNSFRWGPDQRVHGVNSGNPSLVRNLALPEAEPVRLNRADFSFDPKTFDLRAENGGGQHGMDFDAQGRKYACSNSHHAQFVVFDRFYQAANPNLTLPASLQDIAKEGPAAPVFRVSPDEPWRTVRTQWRVEGRVPGPIEGGGRPSGYFTAATGITVYQGDQWPEDYRGNLFVADCGSNLIHRKLTRPDGVSMSAFRPMDEQQTEFLRSPDNWFRPVQMANGPDGNLYVLDMYREVIEHPWSLPEPIKNQVDLNSGNDRGRIYRVKPEHAPTQSTKWPGDCGIDELLSMLSHSNAWHRETAARLLYEKADPNLASILMKTWREASPDSPARLHCLTLLDATKLNHDFLIQGLRDPQPSVRRHATRIIARRFANRPLPTGLLEALRTLATDTSIETRFELALALGVLNVEDAGNLLTRILFTNPEDAWVRASVYSAWSGDWTNLAEQILEKGYKGDLRFDLLNELGRHAGGRREESAVQSLVRGLSALTDPGAAFEVWSGLLKADRNHARLLNAASGNAETLFETSALWRRIENREEPIEGRAAAAQLLIQRDAGGLESVLNRLLKPERPSSIISESIEAVRRLPAPARLPLLLKHWPWLSPQQRQSAANALLQSVESALALVEAVRAEKIHRFDLSVHQRQNLLRHSNESVRDTAAAVLGSSSQTSRAEALARYRESTQINGVFETGRALFEARCASCHRLGGLGFDVGPNLLAARAGGKSTLLKNIVDPAGEVDARYVHYEIELKDGEFLTGLIVGESDREITVANALGQTSTTPRDQIQGIRPRSDSLMPEGLEEGMTIQEMAGLLEFVMKAKP